MEFDDFWAEREAYADMLKRKVLKANYLVERKIQAHHTVCRYWLDNACMSGDLCPFMHEYDLDKVPLCAYIKSKCAEGKSCKFRHYYHPHEENAKPLLDPQREAGAGNMTELVEEKDKN
jgi:hypothetical protein